MNRFSLGLFNFRLCQTTAVGESLGNWTHLQGLSAIGQWEQCNYSPLVLFESTDGVLMPFCLSLSLAVKYSGLCHFISEKKG